MEKSFCTLLFFLVSLCSYCQDDSLKEISLIFDSTVSLENSDLSYGKLYTSNFRIDNKNHPYFESLNYNVGDLTYNNHKYYNVNLKYDLLNDKLITKINLKEIVLNDVLISNFRINNFSFLNSKKYGFLEILHLSDQLSVFKKHYKTKQKKLDQRYTYFKFKEEENYFFEYKNTMYEFKNKNDFIKVLPEMKKAITNYFRANNKLKRKNSDLFMINLIKYLNNLK
ncbi:hypothetical protein P8625_00770 [Tenacibaculum tangerinum]|uniref:Uncharacterized protein n=1 Tax=Tenacibaculum tangerinum TaxID=3038772 RepID=A0ABY8L2Q9_9FLAO|nr:hypothetical protein [Tenacibaculum tangerinum]WGH75728.1 hypothetical protein P8625_00770 [Tenacibaculum tangerinum]